MNLSITPRHFVSIALISAAAFCGAPASATPADAMGLTDDLGPQCGPWLAGGLGGFAQCGPLRTAAMTALAHNYIQTLNLQDPTVYGDIFSQDIILDSTAGQYSGLAEYTAIMTAVLNAFPDIQWQIEDVIVRGNRFVLRYSYSGTHTGDFLGIPASGNTVHVTGLEINKVVDGKIVLSRNFTDFYGLLAQIGGV